METAYQERTGRQLLQIGVVLFALGLFTGFAVPAFANPRMGLASHLEGVMNGTFVNWVATTLAAAWGAGVMMPIAAQGRTASPPYETVIRVLLTSLALAMVAVCVLLLVGLRRPRGEEAK